MATNPSLTMEDEHFVSPRERADQQRFLGHEAFELLMSKVDSGELSLDAASAVFHESTDRGDYSGILLGEVTLEV